MSRLIALALLVAACGAAPAVAPEGARMPVTIRGPVTVTCGEDPPSWAYDSDDSGNVTLNIPVGLRCMIWRGAVVGWGELQKERD